MASRLDKARYRKRVRVVGAEFLLALAAHPLGEWLDLFARAEGEWGERTGGVHPAAVYTRECPADCSAGDDRLYGL